MKSIQEFKEFLDRGNVFDLAVGVVIGAAFSKIGTSLVEDMIMPPIGKVLGNLDFSNLYLPLSEKITEGLSLAEAKKLGPVIAWGSFITVGLNFLIVAFCIFLLVKGINTIKKTRPAETPADPADVLLLREIRNLLKPRG